MFLNVLIARLIMLTTVSKLCQGETCRCGYGGLCIKFQDEFLNAPCLCSEINSGETAVYRVGDTCNELINYCAIKTDCPSCQRAWGYANCLCRQQPNRLFLPDCSANLPANFPSPLQPMILVPTLGRDWITWVYFGLKVESGNLRNIHLNLITSDGRTISFSDLEGVMTNVDFRADCEDWVNVRPMITNKEMCANIPSNTRWVGIPLKFEINLRLEKNIKIENVKNYPYDVAGRMESVTLEMIDRTAGYDNVVFTHKFNVFVDYPPGAVKCAREIRIHGCSTNKLEPMAYELLDQIHLRATFTAYHKCETLKVAQVEWKFNDVTEVTLYERKEYTTSIRPFALRKGLHKISVTVTLKGSTTSHSNSESYEQDCHCYLEARQGKFSFAIVGGDRTVMCNSRVELSMKITNNNYRMDDLKIYWSCTRPEALCDEQLVGWKYTVNRLQCGQQYEFQARVETSGDGGIVEGYIQTVTITAARQNVQMRCVRGCEYEYVNPYLELVLRVFEWPVFRGWFTWTVSNDDGNLPLTPFNTRRHRKHDWFYLLPLALEPGKTYYITAQKFGGGSAKLSVQTAKPPLEPQCIISPSEGFVGGRFRVECRAKKAVDESPLRYELLEYGRNGRKVLIHSATSNIMGNVILHSEIICVRIRNQFAMYSEADLSITLQTVPVSDPEMDQILSRMDRQMSAKDEDGCLEDMIDLTKKLDSSKDTFPAEFKKTTTQKLAEMKIYDEPPKIEQVLNVLDTILNKPDPTEKDADRATLAASNVILNVANSMQEVFHKSKHVHHIGQITENMAEFINTTSSVAFYRDPVLEKASETAETKQIHIRRKEKVGENIVESMKKVADLIMNMTIPEGDEYSVKGDNITLWTANEEVAFLNNKTEEKIGEIPILQFSNEALVRYKGATIGVFVATFDRDWISWSETRPTSKIANIFLYKSNGSTMIELNRPRGPFYISFPMGNYINYLTLAGIATLPSEQLSVYSQDHTVNVIHFRLPPESGIFRIQFNESAMNKIRLAAYQGHWPSYTDVITARPIHKTIYSYRFYNNASKHQSDFYIGMLATIPGTVDYTINVTVLRCLIYSQRKWRADTCQVHNLYLRNKEFIINCSCAHVSILSAEFFIPPNELVLSQDIFLFANILDNLYVPVLVACILLTYLVLLVWGKIKDELESNMRVVLRLDDNYPRDQQPYIVVTYTSGRCAAGTSSTVALQVIGEKSRSRIHVLESSLRTVLHTSQDDWFLMFTKKPLGSITQVQIWHDNTGSSPDWFCTRIVVYDVKNKKDYVFIVEEWFQITSNPEESQMKTLNVFKPSEETSAWRKIVGSNVESKVRENHHWASIIMRHPRSLYTRSERCTIAVGFLLTTMLISMMFFSVNDVGPADLPSFTFDVEKIIQAIQSMLLSTVATFVTLFFFEKSKERIKDDVIKTSYKAPEKKDDVKKLDKITTMVKGSLFQPMVFKPIVMDESETRESWNIWLFIAWILATCTIVVSSFFIVLYGLKFGQKKSLIWTATFILGIVNDAIVFNPLTIVFSALIVAYMFRTPRLEKIQLEVTYTEEKMTYQERLVQLVDIIKVRTKSEYKPMLLIDLEVLSRKQVVNRLRHELAFSSVIIACLCISVAVLVHLFGIYTIYFKNLEFRSFYMENDWLGGTNIDEIYNKGKFYDYLTETALPVLHKHRWYNRQPLSMEGNENNDSYDRLRHETDVKGFAIDYRTKLVGVPRLRQQRLANSSTTPVPEAFESLFSYRAYGPLTYFGQDRETFVPGWITYDTEERVLDKDELWMYTSIYESETGILRGKTGVFYLGDGYNQNLSWSLGNSSIKVIDLYATNWIDNHTRSVFLEINVFNININLFTTICVLSEFLPSGVYSVKPIVETASLQFTTWSSEFGILILVIVTTIIIGVNATVALYFLSRHGFRQYVASWSGLNNLTLVAAGICFITVFFNRFLYFALFMDKLNAAPRDVYTSLYPAFNYNFFAHCFTGFFIICITSIGITIIHGIIGYRKFKKALNAAKYILLISLCINLGFSYFTAVLCFYYGSPIVEMFYLAVVFREVYPSTFSKMKEESVYQVVMYVGLGVIIFFLFNKASQIYYYCEAGKLFKKQVIAINVAIYGLPNKRKHDGGPATGDYWSRWRERMKKRRKTRRKGGWSHDETERSFLTGRTDVEESYRAVQAHKEVLSAKWKNLL